MKGIKSNKNDIKKVSRQFFPCGAIFYTLVLYSGDVFSEVSISNEAILKQYQQLVAEQQREFEKQREIIARQGNEIDKLKSRLDTISNKVAPKPSAKRQYQIASQQRNLPSSPVGQRPPKRVKDTTPPEIPRLSNTVGGVLTKKGKLILEPSIEYSYNSNNRVFLDAFTFLPALAVGLIDLREIKRHSTIASLTARYGMTDRLELEFKLPYVYRSDSQRSRPVSIGVGEDEIFDASGGGIGDLEFAARYQLNNGNDGWPIFVGNLLVTMPTGTSPFEVEYVQSTAGAEFPTELPTGSGYISIQPSLTALYPTDPGVFFGNLSYSYNAETDESIGTVDPGDTLGMSFGLGFSLNEHSSFSLGYSHKHVFESKIDDMSVKGSVLDIGQLSIGYSLKLSPEKNINLSLGIGTTEDAQDVRLSLRVPMSIL
ncbi:transporter [Neptunomonas japonica]|uniref:transporter n=1 Tax=Neptunomonas japonica TaxID=417574 RepID=UPI000420C9F4|nr:transporter [Neptunomonas japonica]